MLLIKLFTIVVLLMIFLQDIKDRAVYWIWFPLLACALLLIRLQQLNGSGWLITVICNLLLIAMQLLVLTAYFSLKNKQVTNITRGLLGWGDVLFLLSITVYFSVLNYLFFYIISLFLCLIAWPLLRSLSKTNKVQIPLAGLQAIVLGVFLSAEWWFRLADFADDQWLFNLIRK